MGIMGTLGVVHHHYKASYNNGRGSKQVNIPAIMTV